MIRDEPINDAVSRTWEAGERLIRYGDDTGDWRAWDRAITRWHAHQDVKDIRRAGKPFARFRLECLRDRRTRHSLSIRG